MRCILAARSSFFFAFLALAAACGSTEEKTTTYTAAQVEARLAQADAKDGKTDKVVGKCAGCSLHMDGKAENALDVHGYSLHFCSADCKTRFGKDADASVMAMKLE